MTELSKDYYFERLSESNFEAFHALFSTVFHHRFSLEQLEQKYTTSHLIEGKFVMMAFERKSRVAVSSYGAIPCLLSINGKAVLAAQSVDTMTLAAWRGKGLLSVLYERTISLLKSNEFKILFGFPNEKFYPILRKSFLWKFDSRMEFYQLESKNRITLRKMSRALPVLNSIHRAHIDRVFRAYEISTEERICLNIRLDGTLKDDQYYKYKLRSVHKIIKVEGTYFTLKFVDRLLIGDIQADSATSLELAITKLLKLAKKAGLSNVHYFSSDDKYRAILLRHFSAGESLPIGYQVINPIEVDFQKMVFSTIDLDTY